MKTLLTILILSLFMVGCEKPGPIELVDRTVSSSTVQIDTTTDSQTNLDPTEREIDSSGFFAAANGRAFAQIIVAGARFDAPNDHHEASLAQAIFFNRGQPILLLGDTVAYRTANAGDVRVNDLLVMRYVKRFTISVIPFVDTLLGFQYILYNKDGVGGRGFQYTGNSTFRWDGKFAINGISFHDSLRTTPVFRVESPVAGEEINAAKNLRVQLDGNVNSVNIFVYRKPPHFPDIIIDEKPLLKLKAIVNGNGLIIPSAVLRILPSSPEGFLFSFRVENSRLTRLDGYPTDVLMTASYVHHLILRIRR